MSEITFPTLEGQDPPPYSITVTDDDAPYAQLSPGSRSPHRSRSPSPDPSFEAEPKSIRSDFHRLRRGSTSRTVAGLYSTPPGNHSRTASLDVPQLTHARITSIDLVIDSGRDKWEVVSDRLLQVKLGWDKLIASATFLNDVEISDSFSKALKDTRETWSDYPHPMLCSSENSENLEPDSRHHRAALLSHTAKLKTPLALAQSRICETHNDSTIDDAMRIQRFKLIWDIENDIKAVQAILLGVEQETGSTASYSRSRASSTHSTASWAPSQ